MASVPAIGEVIAERYRIERLIGEGGMGAVFQATHVVTGRKCALKWMRSELASDERARTRFVREANSAGKIDHPNVVTVTDAGAHGDSLFITMELLQGEPLSKLIAQGPMAPRACIPLLLQAMRGVSAAHALSVIHRDLKPDNVFLSRRPDQEGVVVKVLDFGIAKADRDSNQSPLPTLTATGSIVGTPQYMSPEQVMAKKDMDHRVDVYALGVILYQCLSNAIPFYAETLQELIVRIATEAPTALSEYVRGLPPGLEAVVHKAIARDPKDRYQTVEAFARALEPFADASAQTVVPNPPAAAREANSQTPFARESSPHGTRERVGPRQILISVIGMAVLIGVMWWITRDPEAEPGHAIEPPRSAGAASAAGETPPAVVTKPMPTPTPTPASAQTAIVTPTPEPAPPSVPEPAPATPTPAPEPSPASRPAATVEDRDAKREPVRSRSRTPASTRTAVSTKPPQAAPAAATESVTPPPASRTNRTSGVDLNDF